MGRRTYSEGRISIIVPVYNVREYLDRCMESIFKQKCRDLEIILVDDGSTDGSGKMCDEYAERDSRVIAMHQKNGGLSAARNSGLDIATGEWIAFADSDDYLEEDMLETLLSACVAHGVPLASCLARFEYGGNKDGAGDGQGNGPRASRSMGDSKGAGCHLGMAADSARLPTGKFIALMSLRDDIGFSAWNKLYHRTLWKGMRYPAGRNYEEVATIYKVAARAGSAGCVLIEREMYAYQIRAGSITRSTRNYYDFEKSAGEYLEWARERHPSLAPTALAYYVRVTTGMLYRAAAANDREVYDWLSRRLPDNIAQSTRYLPGKIKLGYCAARLSREGYYRFCRLYYKMRHHRGGMT